MVSIVETFHKEKVGFKILVEDSSTAANDVNQDLELRSQWAFDLKMSFNPDPHKQAVELVFSTKKIELHHSVISF